MSEGTTPSASTLYRECLEAAAVCVQRAKNGTLVLPDETTADEYTSVAIKSNAQAALSLIQAAVTINKAAIEAKASNQQRGDYRRRSA